jgi:hypothetical protein
MWEIKDRAKGQYPYLQGELKEKKENMFLSYLLAIFFIFIRV